MEKSKLRRFDLKGLKRVPNGYWYLASPYTQYLKGHSKALDEVSRAAAFLLGSGVGIYCPIAHSVTIAERSSLDAIDYKFWMETNYKMMYHAHGAIVVGMDGWNKSRGVEEEIDYFLTLGKPIYFMEWDDA